MKALRSQLFFCFCFLAFITLGWNLPSQAEWPSANWFNGPPWDDSPVTVLGFVSAADMQFFPLANMLKHLEKRYSTAGLQVALVVFGEKGIPFSEIGVRNLIAKTDFTLPVYFDADASYANRWRAYLSPSVDLVLPTGKVITFDPGSFDPVAVEKTVQHLLKEAGRPSPPGKEFSPDLSVRCGHARFFSFGSAFIGAWGALDFASDGPWQKKKESIVLSTQLDPTLPATVTASLESHSMALLAQSLSGSPVLLDVKWEDAPVAKFFRGHDIVEEKSGKTVLSVSALRPYEILSHGDGHEEKLKLTTSGQIRLWAVESSPSCALP